MDNSNKESKKRKMHTSIAEEVEFNIPSCKNRLFDNRAYIEEEKLSKELFGSNSDFLENLEDIELFPSASTEIQPSTDEDDVLNNEERKPVWEDDDDNIDVGNALKNQHRTLVDGGVNEKTNQYSNLLKHKFESYHKPPKWANLSKTSNDDDSDDLILQTSGHLLKSSSHTLSSNLLEFKKVRDLNSDTYSEGPVITSVEFHPTSTVAIVAGISGIASIFAVDGKHNKKLSSISFDKYPIECTKFLQSGSEVLLGSRLSNFYSFDLMSAKTLSIPLPNRMTQCKLFDVSPCNKYVAVAGKWGEVHLLSASSKEIIATMKQNTEVTDLAFSANGSSLFGHSVNGEITVWDISNRRVKHKWIDEGCITGTKLAVSPCGKLIAAGSAQGVVNLYDLESVINTQNPKPRKTMFNLTTSISSVKFNSTSEILEFASSELSNSVRLLHVSSGKVFHNFPQWGTKLGRVNFVSFSPSSGYVAFANRKSTVYLYRLKHFKNY